MKRAYNCEVCIVGLGPSGIGAALSLSNSDLASRVICLDQGTSSSSRFCSVLQRGNCDRGKPCQMISGFGGSSLLGGGKLGVFPAGSKLASILGSRDLAEKKLQEALEMFNTYVRLQKPDIEPNEINNGKELFEGLGFEYKYFDVHQFDPEELREAHRKIYLQLETAGMLVLLNTVLFEIDRERNGFRLMVRKGEQQVNIFTKYLVLGVGRLGQSMLKRVNRQLNLGGKANHLDVGVRLEFPTDLFPDIMQYHNDLKLLFNDARTFCVCRDGKIAPYLLEDVFFAEGYYSPNNRSGFTNLGIMTRLEPSNRNEAVLDEIRKRSLRRRSGKLAYQKLDDYLSISSKRKLSKSSQSSSSFWVWDNIDECFPRPVSIRIKEAVSFFASRLLPKRRWEEVNVFAPEVDFSGLSFPVKSDFSVFPGMYVVGDSTGQFRGILQAFCSGMICGKNVAGDVYEKNLC